MNSLRSLIILQKTVLPEVKQFMPSLCNSRSFSMSMHFNRPGQIETDKKLQYEFISVVRHGPHVVNVQLNRPDKRNAMHTKMWTELSDCFTKLQSCGDSRAVVLSGNGKTFCAGIDLMDLQQLGSQINEKDPGRAALIIRNFIKLFQAAITTVEKLDKPVIAAIHGGCIGLGVDLISACDVRYCSKDAFFQIKEVDMGLAADIGTLQRLPKVVGNDSLLRELVYTARQVTSEEAKELQLVSKVSETREQCVQDAISLATVISEKSPIAVCGSKVNMNYSRDHSVYEGLDYISNWNMSMLQSEDVFKAATAQITKEKAEFSKL